MWSGTINRSTYTNCRLSLQNRIRNIKKLLKKTGYGRDVFGKAICRRLKNVDLKRGVPRDFQRRNHDRRKSWP